MVALSAAHILLMCFQKGLGAGSVGGRRWLPPVDKAPVFSTAVAACRGFLRRRFPQHRESHVSDISHGGEDLRGLVERGVTSVVSKTRQPSGLTA